MLVEFFGCEVGGVGEGGAADGAQHGEGGVEHDVGLLGLLYKAAGVGDGNGTVVAGAATHADDADGDRRQQHDCRRQIAAQPLAFLWRFQTGLLVEEPQCGDECHSRQYQIPVAQQFHADDAA